MRSWASAIGTRSIVSLSPETEDAGTGLGGGSSALAFLRSVSSEHETVLVKIHRLNTEFRLTALEHASPDELEITVVFVDVIALMRGRQSADDEKRTALSF